jgi:hypothetical protein
MTLRIAAVAVAVAACLACAASAADNPFAGFKGKVKPGLYEYKVEMDMGNVPGMPPGMGKQTHTMQHCVTEEDVQTGKMGRPDRPGADSNCHVQDMHMSGGTASWKMVCKGGPDMTADAKMAFHGDGYTMDMVMDMQGGPRGGGPMHMKQHVEGKYLGPCSGR